MAKYLYTLLFVFAMAGAGCRGAHDHEAPDDAHDHATPAAQNHEGEIIISEEKAAKFGIETEEVKRAPFAEILKVSGVVEAAPTDVATVTAKTAGIFTLREGVTPGSELASGSSLGTISTQGVQGGDVNAAARVTLEAAKKELDRLTPLYKEGLVTASAYNEALRQYNEAKALAGPDSGLTASGRAGSAVTTPIPGILTQLLVNTGEYVDVGTSIAVVCKNTAMTLRADVPATKASSIHSFTSANFRPENSDSYFSIDSLGGRRLSAPVGPSAKGYIPLYFSFRAAGDIMPGSFAEVMLIGKSTGDIISVPRESLVELQGNHYVYVAHSIHDEEDHDGHDHVGHNHDADDHDGHDHERHDHAEATAYEKRLVETGASDGLRVAIKSGLAEGDIVVTKGAAVVRMMETTAIAPPSHTHNH